jgi:hypothetical protein
LPTSRPSAESSLFDLAEALVVGRLEFLEGGRKFGEERRNIAPRAGLGFKAVTAHVHANIP